MRLKFALPCLALAALPAFLSAQETSSANSATTGTLTPETIPWVTDMDEPQIGSPKAIRGGNFRMWLPSYPETFRLVGPNSNGMFANWNNAFGVFGLVGRHPTTDEFIPGLASHWYVADDNRTVYYKLDERARWSDGKPVTADDYTFAWKFYNDPLIRDPFYNNYYSDLIEAVEKLDTHTIKIVGKRPSWRPLVDFGIPPVPRHTTQLDESWVDRANYVPPVTVGPYTIDLAATKLGERVTFRRVQNWWGDQQRYNQFQYNPDTIECVVIEDPDRVTDYLKRGELDYMEVLRAQQWAEQMNFPELQKGWIKARRIFLESPEGMSGFGLNLRSPVFQDVNFRKAVAHLFNFDAINEQLMFKAYYRKHSTFHGTPFAAPDLKTYEFNPKAASEYLKKAGFTKRGSDGILENPQTGQRASFNLQYGSASLERHLTVLQQFYKRGGIDMKLQRLEGAAAFSRMREKATEAFMVSMTAGFYPEPFQYFYSDQAGGPDGPLENTNNFWEVSDPRIDELIDIYRYDMDEQDRLDAMHELDRLLKEKAFYIPGWSAPYTRILYWDYVGWPEEYFPKRASGALEAWVFWIDPAKKQALEQAKQTNSKVPGEPGPIDVDPYGVKASLGNK